jgi:hypothetical protein
MDYPDISNKIETVAKDYQYHKVPQILIDIQNFVHEILLRIRELWYWLKKLLAQFLPSPTNSSLASDLLRICVLLAGIVGLFLLVYFLGKKFWFTTNTKQKIVKNNAVLETFFNAQAWKQKAEQLVNANDFRSACRALFLSGLQDLDEKDIAPFAPTKTNYEYTYLLASFPQIKSSFKELADLVEPIWYGYEIANKEDYLNCLTKLNELEDRIGYVIANRKELTHKEWQS